MVPLLLLLLAWAGAAAAAPAQVLPISPSSSWQLEMGSHVSREESVQLREEVREMFHFTFDNYMQHAFPMDELKPLSCAGTDTLGSYALTLVDALDSIALMGNQSAFSSAVHWVSSNLNFDTDTVVSVFETNIRVLGGLLSAHLIASDPSTGRAVEGYNGGLLVLALDLGQRLLPAFGTPTGIPYGAVNLRRGVAPNESHISSTAGGGTLSLEFSLLSRLSGDRRFEVAAKRAVRGLWARRSRLGLVGAHIDVRTGTWTHRDSGIGTSIDSFFEYLFKAQLLLGDEESGAMFAAAYAAVERHCARPPWYVEVNMDSGVVVWPLFNSLQAFWPGLQALAGRLRSGAATHAAFMSVWRRLGFTPEGFNLAAQAVQPGQASYPLRPELAESAWYLYRATGDPSYLAAGRDMVLGLRRARAACGYARVADVATGELSDDMESFFLAETVKYLFLLFDAGAQPGPGPGAAGDGLRRGRNLVDNSEEGYVFNTEGHMFPRRREWREGAPAAAAAAAGAGGARAPPPRAQLAPPPPRRGSEAEERHAAMADEMLSRAALMGTCPIPQAGAGEAPPPGLPPLLRAALSDFGPSSAPVRALAAEVASAQQGLVAAQLLAHVAAAGLPVGGVQVRVQADAEGRQRVTLLLENGHAPVWATAQGLSAQGLLALPQAEARADAAEAEGGEEEEEEDDVWDPPDQSPEAEAPPGSCPVRS